MTRWIHLGVVVAGLVWGSAVLRAQPQMPVPFEGYVRDVYKRTGFLEGATVEITSHRTGAVVTLTTDVHGRFSLAGLEPGTYTIVVSRPGYGRLVDDNFCVVPGAPAKMDAALGPDRGGALAPEPQASKQAIVHAPVPVPNVGSMTLKEVRQAMSFGRSSTKLPAPKLSQSGFLIRRRIGTIFPPFWRVATMSQIATATKRPLAEAEIPPAFTQKMAWIVASPEEYYEMDYGDMDSPQYLRPVGEITVLDKSGSGVRELKPAWTIRLNTECDITMLESVLGPQFRRPSLIAAFPLDVIKSGNVIRFRYSISAASSGGETLKVRNKERRVAIKEADARKWK